MRDGYTHIHVVLDSSGSMLTIKKDTIGGFNSFLQGQKETAKDGDTFTFVKFSSAGYNQSPYTFAYKNADIKTVHELTEKTFIPSGGTALIQTLVDSIKDLGVFLHSLPESQKPSKVIFVIITDGEENSSPATYSKVQVNALISEHTNIWKWEFIFLGANQDAIKEAASYGISWTNSMSYGANELGIKSTFDTLTRSLNSYKADLSGASYATATASAGTGFTVEARNAAMGGVGIGTANGAFGFSNGITPLQPSKTENVKDDGHEV
jgi:hypothetical protein